MEQAVRGLPVLPVLRVRLALMVLRVIPDLLVKMALQVLLVLLVLRASPVQSMKRQSMARRSYAAMVVGKILRSALTPATRRRLVLMATSLCLRARVVSHSSPRRQMTDSNTDDKVNRGLQSLAAAPLGLPDHKVIQVPLGRAALRAIPDPRARKALTGLKVPRAIQVKPDPQVQQEMWDRKVRLARKERLARKARQGRQP